VSLLPSSVISYRPKGGDALRLGNHRLGDTLAMHHSLWAEGLRKGDEHPTMVYPSTSSRSTEGR